jgi:hypothetical protein
LHFAVSTTVSYPVISSFRITKVRVFAVAEGGSGTELNTAALTFYGGLYGKNVERACNGTSATPGILVESPPPKTMCNEWHSIPITGSISGNGEPILLINSQTTGVIVDISLEFVMIDGTGLSTSGIPLTVSGATAFNLYTNYLDNSTSSGGVGNQNLFPVGRGSLAAYG